MNSATLGEHVRESRFIHVELGVIVALVILIALVWIPKYQVSQDLEQGLIQREAVPEHVDRYRRTLAQILGGIAILAGLYFTHRRLLATERNVEIARENQEATERQVEIAREGQITERFTRAIEQLGDEERLTMRLGGIYALERIARDSERDHRTVMEVLMAFVRENAPPVEEEEQEEGSETRNERVAPDVQAALTVIGRRNVAYDPEERFLNLSRVCIPGAFLRDAKLNGAQFAGAELNGAWLAGAELNDAELVGAKLNRALLFRVKLVESVLFNAELNESLLEDANLSGTWLNGAKLLGANLSGTDLTGANLAEADLTGADLTDATYELEQLAEAESVEWIKGLSDEDLAELERLRQVSDEDGEQPREEGDSQ